MHVYVYVYVYICICTQADQEIEYEKNSSQIEYEKKLRQLRPQTANRICKQHMQIEYEHMIYVQCCMCMQYSTALPAASTV